MTDLPKAEVALILLGNFFAETGTPLAAPVHLGAYRGLHSTRVESAWLSGRALAQMVAQERLASTS